MFFTARKVYFTLLLFEGHKKPSLNKKEIFYSTNLNVIKFTI